MKDDSGAVFRSPKGMIGGYIAPAPWDVTHKIANETFWWSEDGQGKALVQAYENWAKANADEIRMSMLCHMRPLATARVLGSLGYMAVEENMVKTW